MEKSVVISLPTEAILLAIHHSTAIPTAKAKIRRMFFLFSSI